MGWREGKGVAEPGNDGRAPSYHEYREGGFGRQRRVELIQMASVGNIFVYDKRRWVGAGFGV